MMVTSPGAINDFLAHRPQSLPDVKNMCPDELVELIRRITGMRPKFVTKPRPPQLQGLAAALYAERFVAFYDMRLGKTKLALDWAQHLAMSGLWAKGKGLVVVPAPVLLSVWQNQARLHSVLDVRVVGTSMAALEAALASDADLIVVAWSGLQALFTTRVKASRKQGNFAQPDYETIEAFSRDIGLVIFDEIHACKNPHSLRFQIGAGLVRHSRWRMGLTGTPWGRNPLDVWAQSFLVDAGVALTRNYYFFETAYATKRVVVIRRDVDKEGQPITVERKIMAFDKTKMLSLQAKLGSMSLSYRMADQGKGVHEGVETLVMEGDQRAAYEEAIKQLIDTPTELQTKRENAFVKLRQIASGHMPFIDDAGEKSVVSFARNAKMEWLAQFAEDMGPGLQCVLFHEFTRTGELICQVLRKAGIPHAWLYGHTKDKAGAVADFQSGKARWIVCNAASGGMGIDLSVADYQAFIECPLSTTIRLQAERRAQGEARKGRPLYIDDIIAAPVDSRVLGMVKEGKETLAQLFRNPNMGALLGLG